MKKCSKCGKNHKTDEHVVKKISPKGFPTSSKSYPAAHEAADKAEKKKYPKGYEELKHIDRRAGKRHELIGKNTKSGKIEVSEKVKPKLRKEVLYHEKIESEHLRKNKKK